MPAGSPRLASLDQFRGYTVVAMIFVNFVGGYAAVPGFWKHHNDYCSFADTIMPQFFLAVGFAYRLTFLRRLTTAGWSAAVGHLIVRVVGLCILGFFLYHLDGRYTQWAELERLGVRGFVSKAFQRDFFQTLVHIAVTSLWCLPVIALGVVPRLAWLLLSCGLYTWVCTVPQGWLGEVTYFQWVTTRPGIDGGPLGFLTWTIPVLVGSLAYDATLAAGAGLKFRWLGWGVVLMVLGYGLSCLNGVVPLTGKPASGFAWAAPPFVPPDFADPWTAPSRKPPWIDFWTMSQRSGSLSYLVFASGFALAILGGFLAMCDERRWELGMFRTFGQNALAAYILHCWAIDAVHPLVPRDAPWWFVGLGWVVVFGLTWLCLRYLERHQLFLRL